MDQSWYIPRPSLSSNSSKVQSRFYHRDSEVLENVKDGNATLSSASSQNSSSHRLNNIKKHQTKETCIDSIECESPIKRGSRSSQGSSDSEQSIHSASSLLLTVANLENFAKIQERHHASSSILDNFEKIHQKNASTIINIHPNNLLTPHYSKSKEVDQLSVASSTHFTMINGYGRSSMKKKQNFICKRSHQVTTLIVTMSFLFIIGISAAVILIELRNREMPR